jgi:hypothetical protein
MMICGEEGAGAAAAAAAAVVVVVGVGRRRPWIDGNEVGNGDKVGMGGCGAAQAAAEGSVVADIDTGGLSMKAAATKGPPRGADAGGSPKAIIAATKTTTADTAVVTAVATAARRRRQRGEKIRTLFIISLPSISLDVKGDPERKRKGRDEEGEGRRCRRQTGEGRHHIPHHWVKERFAGLLSRSFLSREC